MLALLGVDEDWSKVDPAAAWAAGYRFVIGYVSQDTTGKNLTRPQIDALHAVGFAVGLVFEYDPQSALGGATAGARDAGIAIQVARALGTPGGVALYTAVDFNATTAQLPTVLAYAQAFQAACAAAGFRSGVYADYAVCAYLAQQGYTGFLWQTYAWSGTPPTWWAGDAIRQTLNGINVAGATVDNDMALVDDWGQWEAELRSEDAMFLAVDGKGNYYLCDGLVSRPLSVVDAATLAYLATDPAYGPAISLAHAAGNNAEWTGIGQLAGYVRTGWSESVFGTVQGAPVPAVVDTHALATDLLAQLQAAGFNSLTADGVHGALVAALNGLKLTTTAQAA